MTAGFFPAYPRRTLVDPPPGVEHNVTTGGPSDAVKRLFVSGAHEYKSSLHRFEGACILYAVLSAGAFFGDLENAYEVGHARGNRRAVGNGN